MPAMVVRFAAAGKLRGLVAVGRDLRYTLGVPPKFVRPCVPSTAKSIPRGDAWLHEPKLDGYRLQVVKSGRTVRLYSRNGYDWTKRLAALVDALKGIAARSVVLDAELCFPAPDGAPDFYGLPSAMRAGGGEDLAVFAFDLLYKDGTDLCPLSLKMRKNLLANMVHGSGINCLYLVASFPDGEKLLASAARLGLEGIVSKRRAAPYRSGECRDWRKVKTAAWRVQNQERWRLLEKR